MSQQRNPDTKTVDEQARRRKGRRDKAAKPVASDYGIGDVIVVETKEQNGFLVHAEASVFDVLDFKPLTQRWRYGFNLIVMILSVDTPKYQPIVGHLFQVETEMDSGYYFGGRIGLSKMTLEAYRPW